MYQPKVLLTNGSMSPLFEAVIEATEEAIYNSMFRAYDMAGNGDTVKALPLEETIRLLKKHSASPPRWPVTPRAPTRAGHDVPNQRRRCAVQACLQTGQGTGRRRGRPPCIARRGGGHLSEADTHLCTSNRLPATPERGRSAYREARSSYLASPVRRGCSRRPARQRNRRVRAGCAQVPPPARTGAGLGTSIGGFPTPTRKQRSLVANSPSDALWMRATISIEALPADVRAVASPQLGDIGEVRKRPGESQEPGRPGGFHRLGDSIRHPFAHADLGSLGCFADAVLHVIGKVDCQVCHVCRMSYTGPHRA